MKEQIRKILREFEKSKELKKYRVVYDVKEDNKWTEGGTYIAEAKNEKDARKQFIKWYCETFPLSLCNMGIRTYKIRWIDEITK
jgi:hypothetical protein